MIDDLSDYVTPPGLRCGVAKLRDDEPQLVAEIDEAVAAGWAYTTISAYLADKRHIHLSNQTLSRHYRGVCSCH